MTKQYFSTGHNSGPNVLIISGIHGDESHAVAAVLKAATAISKVATDPVSPFNKASSFTFLHGVNDYGLMKHTRKNEFKKEDPNGDERECDLNRLFKPEYETAAQVKDILASAIGDADIVIDVHNSPSCKDCFLVDYDSNAEKILSMTSKTSIVPLLRTANVEAGTVKAKALAEGKLGFTVELRGMHTQGVDVNQSAFLLIDFISAIICGRDTPVKACSNLEDFLSTVIKPRITGIVTWKRATPFFKKYSKGEVICLVESFDGKETQEIKAPFAGYVYDILPDFVVHKGEDLIEFAKNPQEFFAKSN